MRVIGVIDLLGGRAVHAKGGRRQAYRPVEVVAGTAIDGEAARLVGVYRRLGLDECYVADLDAIAGGAGHDAVIRELASTGTVLWLDAGVATVAEAERAAARGASRVIAGLETLPSFAALADMTTVLGADAVAFSLDLRGSRPLAADATLAALPVDALARRAVDAGVGTIVVLDVARVGSGRGVDLQVLEVVRRAAPGVALVAGGGVRDADDLRRLAATGCDGALVATALHEPDAAALVRAGRGAAAFRRK